jgi:pyruvate-formate lyase-activating enzyme
MYRAPGDAQAELPEEVFPRRYSSVYVSHIESLPVFHFQPGSRTLVLGGAGCNFDCDYCSNAYLVRSNPARLLVHELSPERVPALAAQSGCHNIAFALNEPTVILPSLLELAKTAGRAGIPVGILTNGYATPEITRVMGESFAFVNVSLKSVRDEFYRRHVGVPSAGIVMRNIEIFHRLTHVEVTTPIVEGLNDSEIPEIAAFLQRLDSRIPWHVFRLLPEYRMASRERPDVGRISAMLRDVCRDLPYVYFGNFVGSRWVSTYCPECGTEVMERISLGGCGGKLVAHRLDDGQKCGICGHPIRIARPPVRWHSAEGPERSAPGAALNPEVGAL